MPANLRAKLLAILGVAALSFAVLLYTGAESDARMETQLLSIAHEHVPSLELGSRLSSHLYKLQRALQDAVAADDAEALELTRKLRDELLDEASPSSQASAFRELEAFRTAVIEYYSTAYELSRRLLARETGDDIASAIAVMKARQARADALLDQATRRSQQRLKEAFESAAAAQASLRSGRLLISLSCLSIVLALSLWISRRILSAVDDLGAGFVRFGAGDFRAPIHVTSRDEFGELAKKANSMAQNLQRLQAERDQTDWVKSGQAALVLELQGDMDPSQLADKAVRFLTRYVGAPVGALYELQPDETFSLLAHSGENHIEATQGPAPRFSAEEGLLARASKEEALTVVAPLPPDYIKVRSGLGEAAPSTLVLAPLLHMRKIVGVLELAFFGDVAENATQLLEATRSILAINLEMARSRSAVRELLSETQRQAARLSAQEEELRAANEELRDQQEGLREINTALTVQTDELERQRRELEHKNSELLEARQILETKAKELSTVSAYKSQFLANMSHELRTPLNSMLLLSSLLADNGDKNLSEKQVEYCRTIHQSGQNLLSLINQVLDLSKVEAGKQDISLQSVPILEFVTHMQRLFDPLAANKGLALKVEVETCDLPEAITTDPKRVEQILTNLLGNAIKFTERGTVTLRVGKPNQEVISPRSGLPLDRCVALEVSDSGIGIDLAHQDRIFAPFEQLESEPDRRYGGTGLGLTISRELASLLGGELLLRSAVGQGSSFTLLLPYESGAPRSAPLNKSALVAPKALPRSPAASTDPAIVRDLGLSEGPQRTASDSPKTRYDLLLIEDDPVFASALGEVITNQGLSYVVAETGQEGLGLAKHHQPRGIVLDVKLGDIDGFTLKQLLHEDALTRDIPVHFVSGLDAPGRGLALGAVGYLVKPASRADLARLVEALVPRRLSDCRVLVVEDDPAESQALMRGLVEHGFDATLAENAAVSLARLEQQSFHCMVLDLGLPDMDGLTLLQTLQKREATMPAVVVYTGRPLTKPELHSLKAYTEAVVPKDGGAVEKVLSELHGFARRLKIEPDGESSSSQPVDWAGKKILIADDDMRAVYALSALLRAHGAVPIVVDGGEALLEALRLQPDADAVIIDIIMSEMDGYETMRRIRSTPRFRALPIIALTAKAMRVGLYQCLEAGATGYVAKPVDPGTLFTILEQHLRAVKGVREESVSFAHMGGDHGRDEAERPSGR